MKIRSASGNEYEIPVFIKPQGKQELLGWAPICRKKPTGPKRDPLDAALFGGHQQAKQKNGD